MSGELQQKWLDDLTVAVIARAYAIGFLAERLHSKGNIVMIDGCMCSRKRAIQIAQEEIDQLLNELL